MTTTYPAYTFGGITRPELIVDDTGHIILFGAVADFAATYGTKALYIGLPPGFPVLPPIVNLLSTPVDTNPGANTVAEGAAAGTNVGLTASSTSLLFAPTYSLVGDTSGGGFKINATTGVVTVNDPTKIDFETAPGHAYTVTVKAQDLVFTATQTFTISVSDIAPSTPIDSNATANTVAEGAAVNTLVGITASSTDVNGPGVTWSLNDASGGFKIDPTTGVISVKDSSKIDYETSGAGHSYTVTAIASDGTLTSSQSFTIGVTDVVATTPTDADGATNTVAEGAANGSTVGVTASSIDPNGPATSYGLTDSAGGRFAINSSTGVVTVANGAAIDFEGAPGHAYNITVQATNGAVITSQSFSIGVTDVAPSAPIDSNNAANSVFEGAANGTAVGITASATDPGGTPAATYILTDSAGGRFAIDPNSGIVTVANGGAIDFESPPGHAYSITVQATAGALTSTQSFSIGVGNVNEAPAGTDKTVTINEDSSYTFAATDFGFTDPSDSSAPNSLLAVKITTLPAVGTGTLTLDTGGGPVAVSAGQSIPVAQIGGLVFTPAANANGNAEAAFTFQVQDNGGTANGGVDLDQSANTLTFNVTPTNDAPVNSIPGAQSVNEDGVLTFSNGNGNAISISDLDGGAGIESVTLLVQHGTLTLGSTVGLQSFSNNSSTVVLSGTIASINSALQGLTYTPAADYVGPDTLTIDTGDNGNTGTPSNPLFDHDSFAITVSAVNDAPVNHVPGAQAPNEDANFVFSAANSNAITISDLDGGSGDETVTLTVASGTLALGSTANLTSFTNNAASITLTGTIANINAALDGLTYHGNLNFNGPDSLSITTNDNGNAGSGGAKSDTDSITLNVAPVNDAPAGTDKTIASPGAHTFAAADFGFTDPIDAASAGGANALQAVIITTLPGTGTLTLDTGGGPVAVTTGQSIAVADIGGLVFTPAGNSAASFTFQVQDDGGTANGGVDLDATPNTLTILQNTPPVANDDSLSATEAGGAGNAVAGVNPSGNVILATGSTGAALDTDAEDASSALTVVAVHTGAEGASTGTGTVGQDLVGLHGTLHLNSDGSYTYAVNQNDAAVQSLHTSADTITDQFNYTIQDTGGQQDTATITLTIHGANDLPVAVADTGTMTEDAAPTSFDVIANDNRDPDSTASNAITLGPGGITVTGPAGETFVNADATASIVANQIQVTLNNAHFQQLALGEHATVTVPYTLTGDAGDTSGANLVVTVNGVNDVPVAADDSGTMTEDQSGHAFTVVTNDTPDADHGALNNVTVNAATAVSNLSAPAGENIDTGDISVSVNGSNQVVVNLGSDFQHMKDGESATFDVAYTLNGDQAGDTSTATLHVTVTGANDAPVASNFTFNGANSGIGNTDLVVNDPADGAPDPAGPQKTISASLLGGASDVDGPGPLVVVAGTIATANGGTVTMEADGDFTYKPAAGFTGSDSFTYQVSDQNPVTPGLGTGTVTINVATPKVWYVNASTGSDATGDGSSEKPFASLAPLSTGGSADALDGANDTIFVYNGTYNSGIVLENGQQLIAQNQGLTVNGTALEAAVVGSATINGTVTLASGNSIDGISFGNVSGFSLQDSGASVGTATVAHSLINNANGGAVNIANGGTLAMNFSSITASGTTTSAISLNNTTGSFVGSGGTLNNGAATAADVSITGTNNVNFTYDGNINDTTGSTVAISSQTGGTKDFNGSINGGAISLTNNTGATMSFDGGVTLSTGTANAFTATGGGTVTVTGANNTLTTGTGTALNIANTTIGSGDVTFKAISANGAANGIVLNNTGSSGNLTVTGGGNSTQGGDSSGGVIQNTTGDAISLTDTANVSFTNMNIHNNAGSGIHGTNVTGFTFDNGTLSTNGNSNAGGSEEANIRLDNLLGSAAITDSSISGGYADNLLVMNRNGTLNGLTVTNNAFGTINATGGNDNIHMEVGSQAGDNGTLKTTISNNTFAGTRADFIEVIANNNTTLDAVVRDNVFHNGQAIIPGGGTAVSIRSGSGGNVSAATTTYDISHNTLANAGGDAANAYDTVAIFVAKGQDNGTMSGTIASNVIGPANPDISANPGLQPANADGIFVRSAGGGSSTVLIQNNTISGYGNAGIHLQNNDGSTTMNASLFGNSLTSPNSVNFSGLFADNGATAGDTSTMNLVVGSANAGEAAKQNTLAGAGAVIDVSLSNFSNNTHFNLSKNGSASATAAGVIQDDNVGSPSVDTSGGAGPITLVNTVPALPAPVAPMLAAAGGVQASSPTPGETHLTQTELNIAVAAAIAQWAHAGASPEQLAKLASLTFSVADLAGNTIGDHSPGHIVIDSDAAGHGWFIDPTPNDNFEFSHATTAADLYTDPSNAAAGHLDLLTVVAHEMGHELGLPDSTATADANDLMYINLVDGQRRLPTTVDVGGADTPPATASTAPAAVVHPEANNFVFAGMAAQTPPPAQIASAHLIQGDRFDFSALPSWHHGSGDAGMLAPAIDLHPATPADHETGMTSQYVVALTPEGPPPHTLIDLHL